MKTYTYRVVCSFALQHSFTESEVENDSDSGESDVLPTDAALSALKEELQATLNHNYAISSFDIHAESDDLLGIYDDDA